jgi:hypothetical protein
MHLTPGQHVRAKRHMNDDEPWPGALYLGPGPDLKSGSTRQRVRPIKQRLVEYPDGKILAVPYDGIRAIEDE